MGNVEKTCIMDHPMLVTDVADRYVDDKFEMLVIELKDYREH